MQINFPTPDSGNFESGYIFLKKPNQKLT